jgi:phenylacetate-CoA ligase
MGLYSIIRSALWLATRYPADEYARLLRTSVRWSREQLEDYRNNKLRKLITHCYENVPYYRSVMEERQVRPEEIRCAGDLDRLPVLTKDIVRAHTKELMAKNVSDMTTSWTKTGGTTGEPMRICKNRECTAWSSMCIERGLRWGGKTVDEPIIKLFGGALGIDKASVTSQIGKILRGDLFIPAFELRSDNAMSYLDKIRQSQCRFLVGYASATYRLAMLAQELDQDIRLSAVFPTAELMLPEWEETIRKTFKCSVLPYYGCGEVNGLGFSVPQSEGYLIPEEHALLEVMQGDGAAQLYGEGRFLITDLDNYAMPIIRYANGDAGRTSAANRHFPFSRIERLDGRYNSFLMTDRGDLISGVIGTHVFRHTSSVQSYRIIQEEPLRLIIKVVPKNSNVSEDDQRLVLDLFAKHLGTRMKITMEKVPSLPVPPSGKSVFVINHCLQ